MKKSQFVILNLVFALLSLTAFGQAPIISYTPNSATLTAGTAMTPMTPTNTGGAVGAFGYSAGTNITGGTLDFPYGVATDASGNVYVANFGVNKTDLGSVSKYNPTTNTWSTFAVNAPVGGVNTISNPTGIAIDNSGNVFVLNYQRTNNGNGNNNGNAYVTEYNAAGTFIAIVVQGLGTANGISINSSNGNIDIAEGSYNTGNTVIEEYTTAGTLNFSISNANISNPVNVATDGSGNIYVLNNTPNKVVKFSSTGTYISTLVTTGLTSPYGLYVDGSNNIYVSDSANGTNTIKIYNAAGTALTSITGLTNPEGLATDSKGNLYVSDYANNTLTKYGATGGWFISGKLPAGLSFDYTTGTISGTPTVAFASTTYTITAYNASGTSNSTTVTLKCNASTVLPTITYNPFSVNVYTTNATITTLTPTVTNMTSPATGPFSYSISGTLPAGLAFSTTTGQISGKPTAVQAATLYTITATNGSGSATTNISIATVIENYWIGKTSADWKTASNWSTGSVPTATDYVSIGVQPYQGAKKDPTIANGYIITVAYLTFGANRPPTLTVASGGSLTINNILTINDNAVPVVTGTASVGYGNIYLAPTSVVNVAGAGVLTINSGLGFTLQSNATSSAAIDQITAGSIVGKVSVQRYLSALRGYRLLASPVNNSGVADANGNLAYSLNYVKNSAYITGTTLAAGGFDVSSTVTTTSENPTLYLFREDVPVSNSSFISGNFRGISNITNAPTYSLNNEASTYTIPASNGFLFFFRGDRSAATFDVETKTNYVATAATLTATGYLNQGQIIFRDWYTPTSTAPGFSNPNAAAQGFNLVANPYACTIDLDTYNTTTTTSGIYASNVSPFIYELNPAGNYDSYMAGSAGTIFTNKGGRYIVSGQAFFVLASGTGGQLIFNETAKYALKQVTSPNLFMTAKNSPKALALEAKPQLLRLEMALDTVNKDNILIVFNSNAKPGYAMNEDALYRIGSGKVNLGSLSADKQVLAINQLPLSNGLVIPLKVGSNAYSTYTLNLKDIQNIPQLYDIWLKDALTGDSVSMRTNSSYTFSITPDTGSYGAHRFTLVVRQNPALAYHLLNFTATKATGKQVQVTWTTENEFDYTNFTVERSTDGGATYTIVGSVPSTGAGQYSLLDKYPGDNNQYRLKQEDINNNITYSSIIPVNFATQGSPVANNGVNIYPNPAASTITTTVNAAANDKNPVYKYTITNNYGLIVRQGTSPQSNWQTNVNDLLPGTYIIQVVNNKDKSFVGQSKLVKL